MPLLRKKTKIIRAPKPWFTENIHRLKPKPWFTENIHRLKSVARKAERLWRKYKQPHQYETMKSARNTYNYELNREKRKTLSEKVLNCKEEIQNNYINLLRNLLVQSRPDAQWNSGCALAENFADYFMNKIDKIWQSLKDHKNFEPMMKDVQPFVSFQEQMTK